MMRRSLVMSSVLVLAMACGDEPQKKPASIVSCAEGQLFDPATDECVDRDSNASNSTNSVNASNSVNSTNSTNSTNPNSTNAANNTNPNNVNSTNSTNSTNPNNSNPNNTNAANNTNPNNANPNNTNPNNTTTTCTTHASFGGQIGGTDIHDGGTVLLDQTYNYDAGLDEILTLVPQISDDPNTLDVDEGTWAMAVPRPVNEAMVVATDYGLYANRTFWVIDRNAALAVRLPLDVPNTVRVGQIVSFNVTSVTNYEGHPQISGLSDWDLIQTDAGVPVRDASSTGVRLSDYGYPVKFGGKVISDGAPCGGDKLCYDVESEYGVVETLRTNSQFVARDACVTFVGPAGSYPGPLQDPTAEPQLNSLNHAWITSFN